LINRYDVNLAKERLIEYINDKVNKNVLTLINNDNLLSNDTISNLDEKIINDNRGILILKTTDIYFQNNEDKYLYISFS